MLPIDLCGEKYYFQYIRRKLMLREVKELTQAHVNNDLWRGQDEADGVWKFTIRN